MRHRALWLLLLVATACGYTLAGSGLEHAGAIAIRTPQNHTAEAGVEYVIADALRRELLRRSGGALAEEPERADLVVSGRVREIESSARGFSSAVLAREFELAVELELEAARRDGSRLALPAGSLRETERYLASADVEVERKNKEEALRRVASLLAARFFDTLSEADAQARNGGASASAGSP